MKKPSTWLTAVSLGTAALLLLTGGAVAPATAVPVAATAADTTHSEPATRGKPGPLTERCTSAP
ncbi:hypothetical protein [Microbacterium sp.]|uniref:hypothetical protein n=1 Tax=Microbacterium sp. TaxID=51671 RepID=UPI0028119066|nr:hypothetical protein [Microbacterium sp.]